MAHYRQKLQEIDAVLFASLDDLDEIEELIGQSVRSTGNENGYDYFEIGSDEYPQRMYAEPSYILNQRNSISAVPEEMFELDWEEIEPA
jgi:hypothetical protein